MSDTSTTIPENVSSTEIGLFLDLDALLTLAEVRTWADEPSGPIDRGLQSTLAALADRLAFVAIVYTGPAPAISRVIDQPGRSLFLGYNGLEAQAANPGKLHHWQYRAMATAEWVDHLHGQPGVNIRRNGVLRALTDLYPDAHGARCNAPDTVRAQIGQAAGEALMMGLRVRRVGAHLFLNEPPAKGHIGLGATVRGIRPPARVAIYLGDLAEPGLESLDRDFDEVIWVQIGDGRRASVAISDQGFAPVWEWLAPLLHRG